MNYTEIKNKVKNYEEFIMEIMKIHPYSKKQPSVYLIDIDKVNTQHIEPEEFQINHSKRFGVPKNSYHLLSSDEKKKLDFLFDFYGHPDFKNLLYSLNSKINIEKIEFYENEKLIYPASFLQDVRGIFKYYNFDLFMDKKLDFMVFKQSYVNLKKFMNVSLEKSTDKINFQIRCKEAFEKNVQPEYIKEFSFLWKGLDFIDDENLLKNENIIYKRCFEIKESHLMNFLNHEKFSKIDIKQNLTRCLHRFRELSDASISYDLDVSLKLTIESRKEIDEVMLKRLNKFLIYCLKEIIPQRAHLNHMSLKSKVENFLINYELSENSFTSTRKIVKL